MPVNVDCCGNCQSPLTGEYCSACGQRRAGRVSLLEVSRQAALQMVDADGPWWRTFRDLCLRPSAMLRDWWGGARRRYVNPLVYAIAAATLVFVAARYSLLPHLDALLASGPGPKPDAAKLAEIRAVTTLLLTSMGYLMALAALPVAWLLSPLWRETRVGERYVALLFLGAQTTLFSILFYPLLLIDPAKGSTLASSLDRLLGLAYFAWSFSTFWPKRGRGIAIGALAFVLLQLMLGVIAALLAKLHGFF